MSSPPSTPDRPDRVAADVAQRGDELAVDDAPQDRRGDLERGRIGDPQAALEPGRHAEALQPLGHPLAAAVDEHDRPLAGDRGDLGEDLLLVGERRPAELDDDDLAHRSPLMRRIAALPAALARSTHVEVRSLRVLSGALRSHAPERRRRSRSRRVLRVLADVALGEVAAEGLAGAVPEPEVDADQRPRRRPSPSRAAPLSIATGPPARPS